ncbi:CDP-glycerol glycerophosphotransferase family protein [Bacillus salipaludis]|uniref:CDP-glycerol glycerophosphotransferase family protein n=1 Tax=Bacillus salipaludis TaxID=2547811 RepID=A0A4R5VVB2_9BACI|nr:CDP-glycerol glycerophosphotransferase family protein [Bacillus salipaludis]TDK62185.1 CDP-glycerol glycerophosphotransferase family protein [Bacillus salipaludis]
MVLNRLRGTIKRTVCSLSNVKYQNDRISILIKLDFSDEAYSKGAKFLYLINRKSKESLKFPNSTKGDDLQLQFEILVNRQKDFITNGIWDAYLQIEKEGKVKKIRIQNKYTDFIEAPPFYIKDLNKNFLAYATVKRMLSFKCVDSEPILKTESFVLEGNGILRINGYLLEPSWKVRDLKAVQKRLILRFGAEEEDIVIPLNDVIRDDISNLYGQTHSNYDWAGFSLDLDFRNHTYGLKDGITAKMFIRYEFSNQIITLPIMKPLFAVFNKTTPIQTSEGIKNIVFKEEKGSKVIEVLLIKEEVHAEVDTIYSEQGEITLHGRMITTNETKHSLEKAQIVVKRRSSDEFYLLQIETNLSSFHLTIDLKSLMDTSELFSPGIWDLYLQIENKQYRLVTRLDGIVNKQKFITFPQHRITNSNGNIIAIKPYYTLYDEVSILSRDYISSKTIEKAEIQNGKLLINGKLHIQNPNEDLSATHKGHIIFKGPYGRKYNLPVIWELKKTEKAKYEFQFSLSTDLTTVGLREKADELLKDINFDLIYCEIFFEDGSASFTVNITPEKVVLSLEDQLKQTKKNRERLSKWGLRFYRLCNKLLPVNRKAVIFQSFYGKSYSDNPKAIYEEMLAEHRNFKAIWVLNNLKFDVPGNPILVRPRSFKYYYYMAISKYFVNNGNFPDFYVKRKGTVHLQTWHGTPLKKLGFDVDPKSIAYAENTSPELLKRIKRWDYLIGPNQYTADILKRAYKYKKQMLPVGYPRNDIFYKGNLGKKAEKIKEVLNIPRDKKVILYAPTWRDYEHQNGNQHKAYEFKFDLKAFKEKFAEGYVLLARLHYFDASRIKLLGFENFVYNVSSYDDISELYLITDLLITDYSSVMFDFANLSRPMIFFAYDLKRYGSQVRGFYFNFSKEAPGPIVTNQEGLFEAIENISEVKEEYQERYDKFRETFCEWEDGQASKRTIEAVFKEI